MRRGGEQPPTSEQEKIDIAFRVIADHIRALSASPSPTESFRQTKAAVTFCAASCVAQSVTDARSVFTSHSSSNWSTLSRKRWATFFPKSESKQSKIKETIKREEESFNKTLDRGLNLFQEAVEAVRRLLTPFSEILTADG